MKEIQKYLKEYQENNNYKKEELAEYNAKFREEFAVFLENFPTELKQMFKII